MRLIVDLRVKILLVFFATSISFVHASNKHKIIIVEKFILEDKSKNLTINDVSSAKSNHLFQRSTVEHNLKPGVYWYKFTLKNNFEENIFLETSQTFNAINFYIPKEAGEYIEYKDGYNFEVDRRILHTNKIIFPIPYSTKEKTYYLRYETTGIIPIYFSFSFYDDVFNREIGNYFLNGLMAGLIILSCFYTLVLYFRLREKAYLFYTIYAISYALYIAAVRGLEVYLTQYWAIPFGRYIYAIPFSCMTVALILYAQSLLDTRKYLPFFHKLLNASIVLKFLVLFLGMISFDFFYNPIIDDLFILLTYVAGIIRLRQGFHAAKYFVIGLSILLIGLIIHGICYALGLNIHLSFFDFLAFEKLGFYELCFFAFALASRFKILKTEKEQTQLEVIEHLKQNERQLKENELLKDKVNRELEEKVKERTAQIEAQAQEIERINQLLKADNENLDLNVKHLSKARVMQNPVSFEEFKKIYPDEDACYKFLLNLKWGNGYQCKKCANTKWYLKSGAPYTYVCTACKYAESATAGTIFNRLHFPIEKAFYMLFLLCSGKKITAEELSDIVDLRRQTCSKFKKTVVEVIEQTGHLKNKETGWSQLIHIK